ncbi:hypothetical protein [Epilithonimonas hominis]|uniref:hypothetical protein n=1 Tax=Epilithonimonas hominis TaxID=420404 RepID=UPI0028989845|nr:hypothetical protein [Epilithonimonas hominis]
MEIKFISSLGPLDISNVNISIQENNSKVSDTMYTKYTLPFQINANQEFLRNYGDYVSYETTNLQNRVPGYLQFENKVQEADLFIQSIEGYKITAQIDFGFEELPNFNKKLSELPTEKFDVPDIYAYATAICKKKWPETNFNFPRIYTDKYSPDSDPWENFDGYYNDLKKDGTEMRRNYIDGNGTIFNVNIIHPCPHPIYLLKTGFLDAGFELQGDILTDQNLQQKWVFSGTEYFSRLTQRRLGLNVQEMDYDISSLTGMQYIKGLQIEKQGSYRLKGFFNSRKVKGTNTGVIILNGSQVWSFNSSSYDLKDYYFDFTVNVPANSTLIFILHRVSDSSGSGTVISADVIGDQLDNEAGEDNGVITNPNKIDLSLAVPDITFGDFVNVIKNWLNYDIEIVNKTIFMNRIGKDGVTNVKDFRFLEIPIPKRNLLNKKSFLLKFTELDEGYKKDSLFFDYKGQQINGVAKEDTSTIEINGYAMPVKLPKPGGYNTAFVAKDSVDTVALVEYSGLQFGQNNATFSSGMDFPVLFDTNWRNWLRQRINGQEYQWKAFCKIEEICNYSVKDYIYCYNNVHIIKSINKEKVSSDIYQVEIITETVV